MRQEQAQAIVAQLERDYVGRIRATVDTSKAQPDGNGYRVALLLLAGQRRASIGYVFQVQSILDAWQPFFAPSQESQVQA